MTRKHAETAVHGTVAKNQVSKHTLELSDRSGQVKRAASPNYHHPDLYVGLRRGQNKHTMWGPTHAALLPLLLLVAMHATAADAQPMISGLSPAAGSLAGGTRLVISGSGFSRDPYTGGNIVYVGTYPCRVLTHKTSDSLVSACSTVQHSGGLCPP